MSVGATSPECGIDFGIDVPHLWAPEAYDLDMDRTTTVSEVCLSHLEDLIADPQFGVDLEAMKRYRESDAGSYNPLLFLQRTMLSDQLDTLGQAFLDIDDPSTVYPDTMDLYARIAATPTTPNMSLTYGKPYNGQPSLWQGMKAPHSKFEGYVEICDTPDKGNQMMVNFNPHTGLFNYLAMDADGNPTAVYHVSTRILVDDKYPAMANLSKACRGIVIVRPDQERLKNQGTEPPEQVKDRVQTVASLADISMRKEVSVSCAGFSTVLGAEQINPYAFKPIPYKGEGHFGLIVSRDLSFKDMRQQIQGLVTTA